jgi:acetylglutamate kinase
VRSRELSRKERLIVEMSRRLTHELVRQQLLVAITSPLNLLGELFTVTGAGTLMRRGASIVRHEGWDGVDRDQLRALLQSSFGRAPSGEFFARPVWRVYREEAWRGAAVLVSTPLGAYLTKFAVTPEARGEGIARDLWDAVMADAATVFWRARVNNPIADWYLKLCDGMTRRGDWVVYWKGLAPERIPEAVASALAQPVDIPPAPA